MGLVWVVWAALGLVVPLKFLATVGDHFFFLAVLADALNADAVGRPASPGRAIRSLLPDSIRLRLAAMLA